ncbi:MAG: rhodanese-like domain-containing protein [Bacteroidetes bacterium]|nr:MAG: rhodanese-like domain-containing protein [Bacteroidota bacterium]
MKNDKNLNNISLLAFAFVAIVVVINLFTTNNYGRSNSQVVKAITEHNSLMNYHQLRSIASGESTDFVLIDLRSEEEFMAGHLPVAINIPFADLLNKQSIRTLNRLKAKTPVLYGARESDAHNARLLLLAKGFNENIMVLGGNYESALKYALEEFQPAFSSYREEKARFDYRRFMGTGQAASQKRQQPAGIIPAVRTETLSAQGGC